MTTGYYCSSAQVGYFLNANEVTWLADDNADQTADTGLVTALMTAASEEAWSYLSGRYSATTAMDPANYTSGSGVYPALEMKVAQRTATLLRVRQGVIEDPGMEDPCIQWYERVRATLADVV